MFSYNTNITISRSTLANLEQETSSELKNLQGWLRTSQ